jgi:hypothetical protein
MCIEASGEVFLSLGVIANRTIKLFVVAELVAGAIDLWLFTIRLAL